MIVTIFRSSVRARVVINRACTKILSRAPHGLQNAIEGRGKDLGTCGAAILISLSASVSLSASQPTSPR